MSSCSSSNNNISSTSTPIKDDKFIVSFMRDGEVLSEKTYGYYQVDNNGDVASYTSGDNYILLLEGQKYFDKEFEALQKKDTKVVTEQNVEDFVKNKWDPYEGGVEDDGANVNSFFELLRNYSSNDIQIFINSFNESGMTVEDFVKSLEAVKNLKTDDIDEILLLDMFLDSMGINLGEFN